MRHVLILLLLCFVAIGCEEKKKSEPVSLKDVPDNVMKIAKEKLPDVTFERAMRKPNGEFEVIGKNKQGKTREIDVTPSGEVTEIE